jgi:hypothetical protein
LKNPNVTGQTYAQPGGNITSAPFGILQKKKKKIKNEKGNTSNPSTNNKKKAL